jgi:hypothetical protein
MGPWNDFHGYIEVFPWVHGKVSVRHGAQLYSLKVLTLVQEVKQDIIYRRMQLAHPQRMEVPLIRIQAHILSTILKLTALLEYQGTVQNKEPIRLMKTLSDTIIFRIPYKGSPSASSSPTSILTFPPIYSSHLQLACIALRRDFMNASCIYNNVEQDYITYVNYIH